MKKHMQEKTEMISMYFTLSELEHISSCLNFAQPFLRVSGWKFGNMDIHQLITKLVESETKHEMEV